MPGLRSVLVRRRVAAGGAWLVTAALPVSAGVLLIRGEPDWAAFAVLVAAVAALVPLLSGSLTATLPGDLLGLAALPFAVRAAGLVPGVTPFFAATALALLVAVVLDAFTSLSTTPRFAVVSVVVATMAVAGAWTVAVFAADALLGTAFLTGRTELMWDLAAATAAGLYATFGWYDSVAHALSASLVAAGSTTHFEAVAAHLVGRIDAVVHGGE